jgi:hypothetical protein
LSRFGRSFEETGHYLERVFPFLQVRFIAVSDNYDSLTASLDESSLIVPLKNLMNEIYARDISKKVKSSVKIKQQRGEYCGSFAPYGYIRQGTSLVIDEEAAVVVRQIYGWILEGLSDRKIAQKLNELKILPPSRYRFEKGITKANKHEKAIFWYKSIIKKLVANPVYAGIIAAGKYQSKLIQNGGKVKTNRDEWLIFENAHPPIIDRAAYDAAQFKLGNRKADLNANSTANKRNNIFKGLIFCGDCGKYMARSKSKDKYSYVCSISDGVDKSACTRKTIREAILHESLFSYINREIGLAVEIEALILKMQKSSSFQNRQNSLMKRINELQGKLAQNRRFRSSLREDYQDGVLTEQEYTQMRTDYDEEKDNLQQELDSLQSENLEFTHAVSTDNKWITAFRRFENEKQLSAEMVSMLIERIDVFDEQRLIISLKHRDELQTLQDFLIENASGSEEARIANG